MGDNPIKASGRSTKQVRQVYSLELAMYYALETARELSFNPKKLLPECRRLNHVSCRTKFTRECSKRMVNSFNKDIE